MVSIYSNSGRNSYGIKSFIVDTDADFQNFQYKDLKAGSTVFVIETSKHYMLNNQLKWVEIHPYGTGSSSGGGGGSDSDHIIYDGGGVSDGL